MAGKMKAVVKTEPGYGAKLVEVDIPKIGPSQVLIKVTSTSICGTDLHIYAWDKWAESVIKTPQILGHEVAGEVVEIGAQVSKVKLGDFVSAETHIPCGHCYQCETGKQHVCNTMKILGVHVDGVFADYAVIEAVDIWLNDPAITPEFASVQEPLGNAIDTIYAGNVAAKNVLISGAGPIGLLAVGVAKVFGATKIIVSEPNSYRRDIARKMGADAVVDPTQEDLGYVVKHCTGGIGVDFVAEMSGHPVALNQSLKTICTGGSMAMLGFPADKVRIDLTNDVILKEITLIGITGRKMFKTWHIAKRLLKEKRLDLTPAITHQLPLEDFDQGMALMKSGNCAKIILKP